MADISLASLPPEARAEIARTLRAYLDVSAAPRRDAGYCAVCGGNLAWPRNGHALYCRYAETRLDMVELINKLEAKDV